MAVEEDDVAGIPEWVVTFGDMMSLLLTFFIMLVSLSEVKQEELYQAMVESMRQQFGHDSSSASLAPGKMRPRTAENSQLAAMGRAMRANIMQGGNKVEAPVGDNMLVKTVPGGTRTSIGTVVAFAPHTSELTEKNQQVLTSVRSQLDGKPQRIEVRGHTSRMPVKEKFRDNWDLAYERARQVSEFLIEIGIDRQRVRLTVAGEHEPVTAGGKSNHLHENDRVEIFLLEEVANGLRKTEETKR